MQLLYYFLTGPCHKNHEGINCEKATNYSPLSKIDRIKTFSKHALKEALQRVTEHLPYLQLYELYKGKTITSGLPITNKGQQWGRKLQSVPQTGTLYSLYFDGRQIADQARNDLINLFWEQQLPEHLSDEIILAMIRIFFGTGIYYGITKPGDAIAYKKKFFSNLDPGNPDNK